VSLKKGEKNPVTRRAAGKFAEERMGSVLREKKTTKQKKKHKHTQKKKSKKRKQNGGGEGIGEGCEETRV